MMNSDLFFTDLREAIINEYFDICRYFLYTKDVSSELADRELTYYKDCLLHDTEKKEVSPIPTNSDPQLFFSSMNRYASIDVRLRAIPELLSFFRFMTPIITDRLNKQTG